MDQGGISKGLSSYLDAARWLAATAVLVFHTRHVLFQSDVSSGLVKIILALTSFGDEAVIIFFVISGFLVGGLSLDKISRGRFNLGNYAKARVSRIMLFSYLH